MALDQAPGELAHAELTDDLAILEPAAPKRTEISAATENVEKKVIDYYREVTEGYRDWSRNINMHFGIYDWGINPFDREAMLENTNRRVFDLLQLRGNQNQLLDMGCGVGATARFCARQESVKRVTGVTLVDTQVEEARELSANLGDKVRFEQANYHHTPFEDESFDGVYAIESACHSAELDKRSLLKEALRLLKPGARLVICDGFMRSHKPLNPLLAFSYRKTCEHWSVGNFANLEALLSVMQALGYRDIQVGNVSLRIAPSALHIPWVSFKYFVKLLTTRDKSRQHWNHLLAPIWALPLSLHLHRFGYYLISATK